MVLHTLTLNAEKISVRKPGWLFAKTCDLFNKTGLIVFKSLVVRDTDEIYKEVLEFIKNNNFRIIRDGFLIDVDMVFGEGEWTVYLQSANGEDVKRASKMLSSDILDVIRVAKHMAVKMN